MFKTRALARLYPWASGMPSATPRLVSNSSPSACGSTRPPAEIRRSRLRPHAHVCACTCPRTGRYARPCAFLCTCFMHVSMHKAVCACLCASPGAEQSVGHRKGAACLRTCLHTCVCVGASVCEHTCKKGLRMSIQRPMTAARADDCLPRCG